MIVLMNNYSVDSWLFYQSRERKEEGERGERERERERYRNYIDNHSRTGFSSSG